MNIVKRKLKPKMGEEIMQEHESPVNGPKFPALNESPTSFHLEKWANKFTHLCKDS